MTYYWKVNNSERKMYKDEVEVVSRLEIESLVNSAQCPTRVEASVATKDQVEIMTVVMTMTMTSMKGLREGYKWLVKSVITNYLELGTRVSEDMAREAAEEEERRKEVRMILKKGITVSLELDSN